MPSCLDGYSIFAGEENADAPLELGVRDSIASGNIGSNGSADLGVDSRTQGNLIARGDIRLGNRAKLIGNAVAGGTVTMNNGAQVTGTVTQEVVVHACALPLESVLAGTLDVAVSGTESLAPGAYGNVSVHGSGLLKLGAGIYRFRSLDLSAKARLEWNPGGGNIEVFVSTAMTVGSSARFLFSGAARPQRVKVHSQQTTNLSMGPEAEFQGTLLAPLAEIHVLPKSRITGALYGHRIKVNPDVRISFAPFAYSQSTVRITNPGAGFLTNQLSIAVSWTVDGVPQDEGLTENLLLEGSNTVKRCFESSCDSITVIRDTEAPHVLITSPADGFLTNQTEIPVSWTMDGVEQTQQTVENLASEGVNMISRSATDLAGNIGTASIQVTRITAVPVTCLVVGNEEIHFNVSQRHDCIVVQNQGSLFAHKKLTVDSIRIESGGKLFTDDTLQAVLVVVDSGALISHTPLAEGEWNKRVRILATTVRINNGGLIDVSEKGFPGGTGPDGQTRSNIFLGGSHGGLGQTLYNYPVYPGFPVYGNYLRPVTAGSGGGPVEYGPDYAGSGGGMVQVDAQNLFLDGIIVADGGERFYGSGAGGSIWLTADVYSGSGRISASGGGSIAFGGGGRVALHGCIIPQNLRDSIKVTGYEPGSIHLACFDNPQVHITAPADSTLLYTDRVRVRWQAEAAEQTLDTVEILQEGWNAIIRCFTNTYGHSGCDTVNVRVDLNPPVVKILSPLDSSYLQGYYTPVAWTLDGVVQDTGTFAYLSEGPNIIIRSHTDSAGSTGSDTVIVFADNRPPVIELIHPLQSATILENETDIRWKVDGIEQPAIHLVMDSSQANQVLLRAFDAAGNRDSLVAMYYSGTLAPNVVGMPQLAAESLLTQSHLIPGSIWVDNDSIPTGIVFAQIPDAGDTLRYQFPVRYSISRGPDARDLKPILLSVDSMTVNPNTLAAGGLVQVKVVNQGRTAVGDSFDIVIFEDRDLDGRFTSGTDLLLGRTMNTAPVSTTDTLELTLAVTGTLNFNGNRISVELDHGNQITETREDNNTTQNMAACKKLPLSMDYTPEMKWSWRDTVHGFSSVFVTPLVANFNDDNGDGIINGDDIPDVIVATAANSLATGYTVVLDGRTGRLLWKTKTDHWSLSEQAVGDIDDDGKPEIVVIQCGPYCWDRRLVVLDNEGAEKAAGEWRNFNSIYFVPDGINLSDLDGDGKSEIIWGRNVHDYNARLIYPNTFDKQITPWATVDLDADGFKELIGATKIENEIQTRLGIINYKDRRLLRRSPIYNAPQYNILGRIENDSGPRLIYNTQYLPDTAVAAEFYSMELNFIKRYPGVRLESNPPGVYDLNWPINNYPFYFGTDSSRMFFIIGANTAHIPNTNSAEQQPYFSRLNLRDSSTAYRIFPQVGVHTRGTVFDFNDDGTPEVVLVTKDTLYILDANGNTLALRSLPENSYGYLPTVADIDKDGRADIVLGMANPSPDMPGLIVFSNPTWVGARGIYNQTDYTVTNVDDDGRIPRFPTPHWQANNTVNIQCAVGHYACVDISASFPQITLDSLSQEQATARIGNGGAMELPAGIPVSVYATHLGVESLMTTLFTPTRLKAGQFYTAKALLPPEMRGSYAFRFAADDSGNGQGNLDESNETNNSVTFAFMLNNQAPSVAQPEAQYAEPTENFDFQIQASDADGDSLAYALTRGPVGMSLDAQTGAIHWIPTQNPPRCTVEVSVSDPYQGSTSVSFLVYVGNLNNQPPVISSTPGTTAGLNTITSQTLSVYTYSIAASDPESEGILEMELSCLNCAGILGSPPFLEGGLVKWIPFQPPWSAGDSVQLFLRVIDARGGMTTQAWTVRLYRTNNAPPTFASTPNTAAIEDSPWRSPATVFDLDNDLVTLHLDTIPLGMSFSNDSLHWTPTTPGSYLVRLGAEDGFDTSWQRFVVTVAPTNDPPKIVSAAPTGAIAGALYSYNAIVTDEDGDVLSYSLVEAPPGMTVSSGGVIEWRSPQSQSAPVNVELVARDPSNAEARQAWVLTMVPDTLAPLVHIRFSKNPAPPGSPVTVTLETGDNVDVVSAALTLDGSPVTLTNGQYVFTPTSIGVHRFEGTATDPSSNSGTGLGSLRVSNAVELTPPEVSISYLPANPQAGQTVTFTVTASDTDGLDDSRLWVDVDGVNILVVNGLAEYAALRPGNLTARAIAFDSLGASALAEVAFIVSPLGGDAVAPEAHIDSPAEDTAVYGRIALVGTASDANLAYYTLSYRDINGPAWTEFDRSTENVVDDSLGFIDGTTLPNGTYEIRLEAFDRSGNYTTRSVQVNVAGEKKVGPFTLAFQDLSIPMSGLELAITRTYDSRIKTQGDFGIGWQMGMRSITLHENRNQGTAWEIKRTPGLIPQYYIEEGKAHALTVTLPGGRKQEFTPVPRFFSPYAPIYGVMEYQAKPGTYSRLEAIEVDTFLVAGGEFYDERGDMSEPFNPQLYRITLLDSSYFIYDQSTGGVVESGDANGNKVEWQDNAIRHNAGATINFTRDPQGRIADISDGAGRGMQYRYDVLGNLSEVLDANGNSTRFKYGPKSYLMEVIDARGVRAARTEYDEDGRVVRQINAEGDTLRMAHDLENNQEEIVDFNGNSTLFTYDDQGNVLGKTDDVGNSWSYSYDSVGNLLSTTVPGGATKSSTFDDNGNELTSTDELGHTSSRTYDGSGRLLTSQDALGRETRYEYDGQGNLAKEFGPDASVQSERTYDSRGNTLTEKDALGNVTAYEYNAQGWMTSKTDPLERVTRFGHDAAGNVVFEVDPRGDTTRFAYDASGNRILTVNALGDSVRTEYNAINKPVRETDARGNITQFVYNSMGDKIQDIAADSAVASRTFDGQGNISSTTDPVGRVTVFQYDHEKRLRKTTFPDSSFTRDEYDALGRKILSVDANGNETEFEYDNAGRNTVMRDALGRETHFEYDDAGRKTAMVDALGQRTEYEYDAYDRLVLTRFEGGSTQLFGYDLAGRKVSETDQAGNETQFEYDSTGNLAAIVDALSHRTEYAYDPNNNRLTQKDAKNHTTTMVYDPLNRLISKTYPGGNVERWHYDPNGNALSHVKGSDSTAYQFDALNREVFRKYFPSGREVTTLYAADGKKDSVIDHRGLTRFVYDNRGRLSAEEMPNGDFIENDYDAQGNRIRLTTPFGETRYTWDKLNRMDSVVSPQGKASRYFYNAVGNRDSVTHPNGTATGYSYDDLNRLTELRNWRASTLLSRFTYTLNDAGIRTAVDELDSGHVEYGYDDLYRLTSEVRTGTNSYSISYTYDDVGNRLTEVKDGVTTTYTYNSRDQLTGESSTAGSVTYSYDPAGRRTSKTDADGTTSLTWTEGDRLASVSGPGVTVQYEYDLEGRKVKETAGGEVRQFLVDRLLPFGQVILETDSAGNLEVEYVAGMDRLSQNWGGVLHYYLADGQGSVRQLADTAGTVSDTWVYTAFGEILDRTGTTENRYAYTGEEFEPNAGFIYLRQRWLDPKTGQLLSVDPFEGDPQAPLSLHRFLYANASPVSFSDPTGEWSLYEVAVTIAVRGTLFAMRHPYAMATIGFVGSMFIPEEAQLAMQGSGVPGIAQFGGAGRAEAQAFQLIKNKVLMNHIKNHGSLAGTFWREYGKGFENLVKKYLLNYRGKEVPVGAGKHTVDAFWNGILIEIKSGGIDEKQLAAIAGEGLPFTFVFLRKPAGAVINKIGKAGGNVFYLFED